VERNLITNSAETGISLASFDPVNVRPTGNTIRQNVITASGIDGIHVFDGSANQLEGNAILFSRDTDAIDETTGGGTAVRANTWAANLCVTTTPGGLCFAAGNEPDGD
jgi:parallel beta-helix repeat protein